MSRPHRIAAKIHGSHRTPAARQRREGQEALARNQDGTVRAAHGAGELIRPWAARVLFPPLPVAMGITVVSACGLIWVFTDAAQNDKTIAAGVLYALSFWVLVIWCARGARTARRASLTATRTIIETNPIARRLATDELHRRGAVMAGSLALDAAWTISNAYAAAVQQSTWFATLASYYAVLSLMRLTLAAGMFLGRTHPSARRDGRICLMCGGLLTLSTPVFAGFVILAITREGSVSYAGSLIFLVALYAFYSAISAGMRFMRQRGDRRPIVVAANAVSLIVAAVSMLSLEVAMLDRFGEPADEGFRFLTIALTGGVICIMALALGAWMIVCGRRGARD